MYQNTFARTETCPADTQATFVNLYHEMGRFVPAHDKLYMHHQKVHLLASRNEAIGSETNSLQSDRIMHIMRSDPLSRYHFDCVSRQMFLMVDAVILIRGEGESCVLTKIPS